MTFTVMMDTAWLLLASLKFFFKLFPTKGRSQQLRCCSHLWVLRLAMSRTVWAVSEAKSRAPATGLVTVPTRPLPRPEMKPLTPPSVFTPSTVEVMMLVMPPMIPGERPTRVIGCGGAGAQRSAGLVPWARPWMPATRCSPLVAPWYLMYSRSLWCRLSMVFPSPSDNVPANWSREERRWILEPRSRTPAPDGPAHLGCRVGHAVRDAAYETAHVSVLDELGHAFADVVEQAHGVPQEVHGAQDLGRLADQLLHSEDAAGSRATPPHPDHAPSHAAHRPTSLKCLRTSLMRISCVSYGCTLVNGYMLMTASSKRIRGNPRVPFRAWEQKPQNQRKIHVKEEESKS